ncbi:hypothetical protein [Marinicella meishanensis]|uniref:hypothetical protein n=1 Tax=Marinicella meishanensis TaxID=2873263 RepID=UPI001CBF2DF2|nr:hypothetical protein [Marinicella sp. NBU2979]
MKCPQCEHPVTRFKTLLGATKDYPAICHQCRTEFYVRRHLSGVLTHGLLGSGLIILLMFLAFGVAEWLGVLLVVVLTGLLWMALAYIESQSFQIHTVTRSNPESNPSYQTYLWVIIGVIVAVAILSWLT